MNRIVAALCLGSLAACSQQPPAQHAELTPASAEAAPVLHSPRDPEATDVGPDHASSTSSRTDTAPHTTNTEPLRDTHATTGANANATDAPRANAASGSSAPLMPTDGPAADNTKRNERDRDSSAITPIDQGNNESDLKITQQIRQAVMADKSLSFNAKNAKIITANGKVTLRGVVATDAERTAIGNAATRVVGPTQVENLLEVKK